MRSGSPEQITASLLNKTEDFFEEDADAQDLRVAVRISWGFRDFVDQQGDQPESGDADYVMGTIVSGVESFVHVGHSCHCFVGLEEAWVPEEPPKTFKELKSLYLLHFESLANEELQPRDRLQALLSLIRLQLLFLAYFFPWGKMPRRQAEGSHCTGSRNSD